MDFIWDHFARGVEQLDALRPEQKRAVARRAFRSAFGPGNFRLVLMVLPAVVGPAAPWVMVIAILRGGVTNRSAPWLGVFAALALFMTMLFVLVVGFSVTRAVRAHMRRGLSTRVCPACSYPLVGLEALGGIVSCPECAHQSVVEIIGMAPAARRRPDASSRSLGGFLFDVIYGGIPGLWGYSHEQKRAIVRQAWRTYRLPKGRSALIALYAACVPLLVLMVISGPLQYQGVHWAALLLFFSTLAIGPTVLIADRLIVSRIIAKHFPFKICSNCGTSLVGSDIADGMVICGKCHYVTDLALHGLRPGDLEVRE